MVSIDLNGMEYYVPTQEDMIEEHGIDCDCPDCSQAKSSRYGAWYNGERWVEIL